MIDPKSKAPNKAPEINPKSLVKNGIPVKRVRATINEAPELIPKTYGPASGLLNKVCISIPETASALPERIDIVIRGIRNSKNMMWLVLVAS